MESEKRVAQRENEREKREAKQKDKDREQKDKDREQKDKDRELEELRQIRGIKTGMLPKELKIRRWKLKS